ncbi:ABC transporter substrate-binding protein [Bacillus sp. TS-2]|nr:ABC transporter substrate-binding protein [Bacillus sp. TS-2]
MNKSKWFYMKGVLITIFAIAILAGCNTQASTIQEKIEVNFGADTAAGGSLQFRVAKEEGIFEEYGIHAEISNFAYGIDTLNALLVERTHTGTAADYALLNSLGKGDMKIISALTRANEERSKDTQLLVVGDINTVEDLVGKKLGVARGTVYEYVWEKYLEQNNIDKSSINYVPYMTPDEAIVGMQKGDIDAIWIGGALTDKVKDVAGGKEIANLNDTGVSINSYLVADTSFIEEHPETIVQILKALEKGVQYVEENHEETAELAFKELKLPKEDVLKDLERTNYALGFTEEDYKHLTEMKNWLVEHDLLTEDYELNEKIYIEGAKEAFPSLVDYEE